MCGIVGYIGDDIITSSGDVIHDSKKLINTIFRVI